jgi:hypothetical protein
MLTAFVTPWSVPAVWLRTLFGRAMKDG